MFSENLQTHVTGEYKSLQEILDPESRTQTSIDPFPKQKSAATDIDY